ncbi:unnamed protein product (macronuclear) [Paramecium tetraurelia]|uniref:HTH psq-type domain-containing protein n=1 Tax=Paramecium tetraurelia TaxID=5888 RepID=A0BI74_PARTE|nr:uncharacterized protein GSPATT00029277001 [Paramecium tetraurelia]CAK58241.1 unnamed protein product [Paramecium tetraurelia]|eukprot:XP_001425639.1 hypothetical protein (macronuclear) [Paramecium tetraurelia strain d4-2]
MSRNGLEQICNQATNFWKSQLLPQKKQVEEVSTDFGSNILVECSFIEVSAKKTEEFLFPQALNLSQINEKGEQEPLYTQKHNSSQIEIDENFEEEGDELSCSQQQSKRKEKKKSRTRSNKSTKQRITISQEAFIMEQTRMGTNLKDIAQQIPGMTINQIKSVLMKKLKTCSKNNDFQGEDISDLIERISNLQQEENIDNATKIEELRQHIHTMENHLDQAKKLILQKYMILFQQQQ